MTKSLTVIIILIAALVLTYTLPKAKYQGTDLLSQLDIPMRIGDWQGEDISDQLDTQDERYAFVSDIFARWYKDPKGMQLLLLILDAGNFHNPKACFELSGYAIEHLNPITIPYNGKSLQANALLAERKEERNLLIFWTCFDKQITSWTGHEVKELFASILGKKKAGFMIRLDIPLGENPHEAALLPTYEFIMALYRSLPPEQTEYLFGQ
ncbi:MAG: EpsI family protein [Candidatus Omnitrophica bacterium]|nr:EpsI family protein [Candidatus Omnitrophota bacterium]